jgi:hypothetical protein
MEEQNQSSDNPQPDPTPAPDDKGAKIFERLKTDEKFFIELCLSVIDRKSNRSIPFKLNSVQQVYEKKRTSFDMILKARKMGFSSRLIASDIWACAFKPNQHAILISHDKAATSMLLEERVKPMILSSKVPLGEVMRRDYIFFPQTNSRYYIGTAGTKKFGRGADITRYHLSETAHYEDPELITGIEEGCLDGAVGRMETTANGVNFFHKFWKQAVTGNSRYAPIFVPWWQDPDYCIPGATLNDLTEDEGKLIEAYKISHEQLAWRRAKIKNMTRPELFPQEYPSSPDESFLSSGRMVFDWVSLMRHEPICVEPRLTGFLRDNGEIVEFQPQLRGNLQIWETPERLHHYVIGADVAEGLQDGAYSAAFVLDVNTSSQVAEWHGHVPADRFADVLVKLGQYYNNALLVPESWPGPGSVTTLRILDTNYRNLWQRPARSNRNNPEQLWGWETTGRTRPLMMHSLSSAERDFSLTIKSKSLLDEMRSIVYDDGGDMAVQLGCFSDRVMACGIAWAVSRTISEGIHSGKPTLRAIEAAARGNSAVTYPKWQGPRYGVRPT